MLTGCTGMGNPLGGFTRMFQAMGRSVGLGAANERVQPVRLDAGEIERARNRTGTGEGTIPETEPSREQATDHVALAR